MPRVLCAVLLSVLSASAIPAQTTQGLISGRVLNSVTGRPIAGASVTYTANASGLGGKFESDAAGYYFLPLLSAGLYNIRVVADKFQSAEVQRIELQVAGRIQLDVRLRPLSDVWETGQFRSIFLPGTKTIVTFYGPDVDSSRSGSFDALRGQRGTLDTSASYVIDQEQLRSLPLSGRDVYTMLVSLPGVTSDGGTARGLGLSANGQRPSASNYLLDGVGNNNYLVTGPLSPVVPEVVQEYRISTNNYSAEYGRTAGFVANAVTKAGNREYHGVGYVYLKNDVLNANNFADNFAGVPRQVAKDGHIGYQIGGPVVPKTSLRNRLFISSAFDRQRSYSTLPPQTYAVPTTIFVSALSLPADRLARKLLETYEPPTVKSNFLVDNYTVAQPVEVLRVVALERLDYTGKNGKDRFLLRLALNRLSQPDFIWSPYKDFVSGLYQNTWALAGNWMRTWTPRLTSELKFSYADDNLYWDRAHDEVPTLSSSDGTTLPGSPAFYAYKNHNRIFESIFSTVWTRNRHVISVGAGLLVRKNNGYLAAGRGGQYIFQGATNFAFDRPSFFRASIDRLIVPPTRPDFDRQYSYPETYFFAQDSFRATNRLTLNYGVRYDRYGAPTNVGQFKDVLVQFGSGKDFTNRLAGAKLVRGSNSDQPLYGTDSKNFGLRLGFSWDPTGGGKTVFRGGYGIFYDRPFDNLWQNLRNNGIALPLYTLPSRTTNYLLPIPTVLPTFAGQPRNSDFPQVTIVDPKLRNGYAQDLFLGVQRQVTGNLTLEVNGTSSLGRRLITTDLVNRQFTTTTGTGRPNEGLPDIAYRSSQGLSNYFALTTQAKYRMRSWTVQAAYTWSHAIDNQSDPLTGDFFDLNFTKIGNSGGSSGRATFTTQYDSNGDRANSDFDQRHNLFLSGFWTSPGRRWYSQGWLVSALAAFRTGSPYSVQSIVLTAPDFGSGQIQNQRADLLNPSRAYLSTPVATQGGVYLLDPNAFGFPLSDSIPGTSGRNAFRGPGLYNMDLSVARSFSLPKLREGARLTVRADAFNFLNHANLNNPDNLYGSPTFGLATYGRQGRSSGFPAVAPLNETARQIQLSARIEF